MSTNFHPDSGVTWYQRAHAPQPAKPHSDEPTLRQSVQDNLLSFVSLTVLIGIISYLILR